MKLWRIKSSSFHTILQFYWYRFSLITKKDEFCSRIRYQVLFDNEFECIINTDTPFSLEETALYIRDTCLALSMSRQW